MGWYEQVNSLGINQIRICHMTLIIFIISLNLLMINLILIRFFYIKKIILCTYNQHTMLII
jgi:hypothetical protein